METLKSFTNLWKIVVDAGDPIRGFGLNYKRLLNFDIANHVLATLQELPIVMMLSTSTVISSFLPNPNHLFNILVVMSLKRFIAKYIFENSPQTYHQQCLSFLMYWLNNFITRTQAYFFTEVAYGKWMKKSLLFLVLLKLISW